ncbi:MAG: hypothetical protein JRI28_06555 [Deltaproteobacteria bacterium]|nr:hypothetical protein [Deltaproteobacteria bacterium]
MRCGLDFSVFMRRTAPTAQKRNRLFSYGRYVEIIAPTAQKRNRLFSYGRYVEIMSRGTELPGR